MRVAIRARGVAPTAQLEPSTWEAMECVTPSVDLILNYFVDTCQPTKTSKMGCGSSKATIASPPTNKVGETKPAPQVVPNGASTTPLAPAPSIAVSDECKSQSSAKLQPRSSFDMSANVDSVLAIQRWFRRRRAYFERQNRASWRIFQKIEYESEGEQVPSLCPSVCPSVYPSGCTLAVLWLSL